MLHLFSDIVGFTVICSRIKPHEVVMFLNNLYTLFDFLVDQNQVYKVETIGDAYLIVSGCPTKATNHALKICDMAFDMMDGIQMLKDPGTGKEVLMRIGCHSGPVVAGIVGLKMPRYNIPPRPCFSPARCSFQHDVNNCWESCKHKKMF